jgi:hypothetical protein
MMANLLDHDLWNEPLVGALFGEFYDLHNGDHQDERFILGPPLRPVWLDSIRYTVLRGAAARYPQLAEGGYLVIKEPHGCLGAPLLMEALPESRMILILRDPRDVIASQLDAQRKGSWTTDDPRWERRGKPAGPADKNPEVFVKNAAMEYARNMDAAQRAYDLHAGPKALVRYEELTEQTLAVLVRMCSELRIPAAKEDLARVVKRYAWESIPTEQKGPGRFYRKGERAGWKDDLTQEQAKIVSDITRLVSERRIAVGVGRYFYATGA